MVTLECAVEATESAVDKEAGVCILVPAEDIKPPRDSKTGTKLSPICIDEGMKSQATSAEELKKQCFPETFSLIEAQLEVVPGATSASFSSTSISTMSKHNMYAGPEDDSEILTNLMRKSAAINSSVADRTQSRHGRSSQRWLVDPSSPRVTRLVTGCVPILAGGKVMLASASKKNEWILPKGGWEMDEEMEESAIRETFEEAGVIGILGPPLQELCYETRKSKERRLVLEDKLKSKSEPESQFSSGWSDVSQLSEDDHIVTDKNEVSTAANPLKKAEQSQAKGNLQGEGANDRKAKVGGTKSELSKDVKRPSSGKQDSNNGHVTAESKMVYSHVCVSLFPLYVKEVMDTWPESGRLRKSADIDEAIELLAARPEMQSILMEVKARGLHRV